MAGGTLCHPRALDSLGRSVPQGLSGFQHQLRCRSGGYSLDVLVLMQHQEADHCEIKRAGSVLRALSEACCLLPVACDLAAVHIPRVDQTGADQRCLNVKAVRRCCLPLGLVCKDQAPIDIYRGGGEGTS